MPFFPLLVFPNLLPCYLAQLLKFTTNKVYLATYKPALPAQFKAGEKI
jgi:hypothetical protein